MKPVTNNNEAIRYMANWDYGEYNTDTTLEDLYLLNGKVFECDGYILFRSPVGDATLYKVGAVCCAYELRQIDAWCDGEDGWIWNDSYHIKYVNIESGKEEEFLLGELLHPENFHIEYGFECYEARLNIDGRPVYALIPVD